MDVGDRVALVRDPNWTGKVVGTFRGKATVNFDQGGSGTFADEALTPIEDKSWPPGALETK